MIDAITQVPTPDNEPVKAYVPGSADRKALDAACDAVAAETIEIPAFVNGLAVKGEQTSKVAMPHDHGHVLAEVHHANATTVQSAIDGAMKAAPSALQKI